MKIEDKEKLAIALEEAGVFRVKPYLRNTLAMVSELSEQSADRVILKMLKEELALMRQYNQVHPFKLPVNVNGEISIGISEADNFGLNRNELSSHATVAGSSGVGKTTALWNIVKQLHQLDVSTLIFDFKRDYQGLLNEPELKDDTRIFPAHKFPFSPINEPKNIGLATKAKTFAQRFADSYFGHIGIYNTLIKHLKPLIEKGEPFSLAQLRDQINKNKSEKTFAERDMYGKLEARFSAAELSLKPLFSSIQGIPVEEFCRKGKITVLQLHELNRFDAMFLFICVINSIYLYHLHNDLRSKELKLLILLDEAHILLGNTDNVQQNPLISEFLPMLREWGIGVLASTQQPSLLTDSLLANTYCYISFSLSSGKEADIMAKTLSLNREQRKAFTLLKKGQAVVKMADRYTEPFLIQTQDLKINKTVTREQIEASYKPLLEKYKIEYYSPQAPKTPKNNALMNFLNSIYKNPFQNTTDRFASLNLNRKIGAEQKENILREAYAYQINFKTSKRGRPSAFMELLPKGYAAIGQPVEKHNISFKTRYWTQDIKLKKEKDGWVVKIEKSLVGSSKRNDLVATKDGIVECYEIETDPSKTLLNNLKKDAGYDLLIIAVTETKDIQKAERIITDHYGLIPSNITVKFAGDL